MIFGNPGLERFDQKKNIWRKYFFTENLLSNEVMFAQQNKIRTSKYYIKELCKKNEW